MVVLVSTVIIGTTLGGRYRVAPPVLLIVLGVLLGLIPRLTDVELEPDLVLLLFLPAILYWESLNTSWRDISSGTVSATLYAEAPSASCNHSRLF
ncbi:MAG: yjcE [Pseudonocardiales bacterium]|nr:yjcE [Pseudonocardiales bacterium]